MQFKIPQNVQMEDKIVAIIKTIYHKSHMVSKRVIAALPSFSVFYRDCPITRKTANEVILLPTYPRYPDTEIQKNIDVIRAYFKNRSIWQQR